MKQFRMAMRNLHMLCEIQKDSSCKEILEHLLESILHTIYHFKAWEVRSPMLQMVCKSELKWRSYSHLKATAPSWKWISHHPFFDAKISHHPFSDVKISHHPFFDAKILHHPFSDVENFTSPFSYVKIFASPFPHAKFS